MRKLIVLMLVGLGLLVIPSTAGALSFPEAAGSPFAPIRSPQDFTVGDFNATEDDFDDVAVATENGLSIFVSDGDGTFTEVSAPLASQDSWTTVVAGDFDDDGDVDLLADKRNLPAEFFTFVNDGGAGFSAEPDHVFSFNNLYSPDYGSTAISDVDGDDLPDVVTGTSGHRISVALGNGDGTFSPTPESPIDVPVTGGSAAFHIFSSVALGDYNGDGDVDAAMSQDPSPYGDASAGVYVANGAGDGTFTPATGNPALANTISSGVSVGSFNEDALDDLLVGTSSSVNTSGNATSLLGDGESSLIANSDPSGSFGDSRVRSTAVADFNQDGKDDAVTIGQEGVVNLRLGKGAGRFGTTPGFPFNIPWPGGVQTLPDKIVAPDLNGDGFPDLLVSSSSSSPSVFRGLFAFINSPVVESSPESLSYPLIVPGESSGPEMVEVSNIGGPTVEITSASITGTDAGQFELDTSDGCGAGISYNENCSYWVTFEPTSGGSKSASLVIDLSGQPDITVPLSGTGDPGSATVAPESLEFEDQRIGETSATKTITFTSSGNAPVRMGATTFTGTNPDQYEVVSDDCAGEGIPVGETCDVKIAFAPTTTGSKHAFASTSFADSGTSVALSGFAIDPGISVSPASWDFGDHVAFIEQAPPKTVTVSSTGTTDLVIEGPSLTGPDAGDFFIQDVNACHGAKAPAATCEYVVYFAPDIESDFGDKTAYLTIENNAADDPVTVTLTATSTIGDYTLSPNDHDFGNAAFGQVADTPEQDFTITSTGPGTLYMDSAMIEGPDADSFRVTGSDCPQSDPPENFVGLPVGETCDFTVVFDPDEGALGEQSATVTVPAAAEEFAEAELTGTAIDPSLSIDPSSYDFGDVNPENDVTAAKRFTLTSDGETPLDLGDITLSGANASSFTVGPGSCTGRLEPRETCSLTVTLDKTGDPGSRSATLNVDSSSAAGTTVVPLTGNVLKVPDPPGTPGPPDPTPAKLSLSLKAPGKIRRGKTLTLTATVKNTGGSTAASVSLKTTVPGKLAKAPKRIKVSGLAAGASVTKKIKVKVKKSAKKGKKLTVKVTAAFDGTAKSAKKTARIK